MNEELRRTNEKLQRIVHQQVRRDLVPPHFITSRITPFLGAEDPEGHLNGFRAQMKISGGSDVIRCKMFVGTLIGTTLQCLLESLTIASHHSRSSPICSKSDFRPTKLSPLVSLIYSMYDKERGNLVKIILMAFV